MPMMPALAAILLQTTTPATPPPVTAPSLRNATPQPAAGDGDDDAADLAEFFTLVDADHDAVITRAEFDAFFASAAAAAAQQGAPAEQGQKAGLDGFFGMLDADGDGSVTAAEQQKFAAFVAAQEAQEADDE